MGPMLRPDCLLLSSILPRFVWMELNVSWNKSLNELMELDGNRSTELERAKGQDRAAINSQFREDSYVFLRGPSLKERGELMRIDMLLTGLAVYNILKAFSAAASKLETIRQGRELVSKFVASSTSYVKEWTEKYMFFVRPTWRCKFDAKNQNEPSKTKSPMVQTLSHHPSLFIKEDVFVENRKQHLILLWQRVSSADLALAEDRRTCFSSRLFSSGTMALAPLIFGWSRSPLIAEPEDQTYTFNRGRRVSNYWMRQDLGRLTIHVVVMTR
ncbi:hypothetical protein Bca101_057556 [Brassica carinata]